MNEWGARSRAARDTLHADLVVLVDAVLAFNDIGLLEGYRSNEVQAQKLAEGLTKVGPGKSKHNRSPSDAVDMIPGHFNQADWQDRDKWHLFAGLVLGVAEMLFQRGEMKHKVRWGGDWDKDWETSDNKFDDFPHFELI